MRYVGIDTETHLIQPGQQAPRLVCLSVDDGMNLRTVFGAGKACAAFLALLAEGCHVVGHNTAFDTAVLLNDAYVRHGYKYYLLFVGELFKAYDNGQIHDTMTREKLLDLAKGRLMPTAAKAALPSQQTWAGKKKSGVYTLAGVLWKRKKIDIGDDKGEEAVRLRYAEVEHMRPEEWPEAFYRYALADATYARELAEHQDADRFSQQLAIEPHRTRADFALRLTECWGVQIDGTEVRLLRTRCEDVVHRAKDQLRKVGIARADGSVDTKALRQMIQAAYEAAGEPVPMTDPSGKFPQGQVKTDAETIEGLPDLPLDHPLLVYKRASQPEDYLSKYLQSLDKGVCEPLHARYNSLLVTARTSASDYVQTPPRDPLSCFECGMDAKRFASGQTHCHGCGTWIGDVRRCYVARPGFVLCSVDYNQLELCTLAQACYDLLGHSTIGEAINAGLDLHSILGAELMGILYADFVLKRKQKDKTAISWRGTAKGGNFGFPGGMAPEAFVAYVRVNYGISNVDLAMARRIHSVWKRTWHDMPEYFRAIKAMGLVGQGSTATIKHPRTGLLIGDRKYTAACNVMFQHLAAHGALDAGYELCREAYSDEDSPLYASRPVLFLHDEWILEVPEGSASAAALRMAQVMRETMQKHCPNVRISCEPALMRRWYKGAEAVYRCTEHGPVPGHHCDACGNAGQVKIVIWSPKAA